MPKAKPEPKHQPDNSHNHNHYEESEEQGRGVAAKLPTPDAVDDVTTARHARELLVEAYETKLRHDRDTKRLKQLTEELVVISRGFQLPGLRHGRIGLVYNGERSNRYLDKGLLLEHGVSPEVIQHSFKEGKPFPDARFYLIKPSS